MILSPANNIESCSRKFIHVSRALRATFTPPLSANFFFVLITFPTNSSFAMRNRNIRTSQNVPIRWALVANFPLRVINAWDLPSFSPNFYRDVVLHLRRTIISFPLISFPLIRAIISFISLFKFSCFPVLVTFSRFQFASAIVLSEKSLPKSF